MKIEAREEGVELRLQGLPPIWMHAGMPLVAIVLTSPLWSRFNAPGVETAVLVAAGFILSVLAHELGHALTAQRFGLQPVLIRLHAGGGEAQWLGDAGSRRQESAILLAGPLANLAIGAACLAAYALLAPDPPAAHMPPVIRPVLPRSLLWLGWINIALAGINLLPAFPLDGGRLLHNLIEARWGSRRGLLVIGFSGVVLAVFAKLVFLASILAGMPIWSPPDLWPNWAALRAARAPAQPPGQGGPWGGR